MTKPPKTPKPGKPGKTPSKAKTPGGAGSVGSAEDEAPRVGAGGAAGNGKNPPRRVAVVGSGVAGLSAAYLAHRNGMDVTLYESSGKCGGHALTYDSPTAGPVDLGFQVRARVDRSDRSIDRRLDAMIPMIRFVAVLYTGPHTTAFAW
jgi:NADPH-dependent 2,4-dienoyl-CoA reductase/sulfur reductase-like enzyme